MTLDQLRPGQTARVLSIQAGLGLQRRLNHLGIHPGDTVCLSGCGAFHGPLLVQIHGMQVALGRGVARHVLVEPQDGTMPGSALGYRFERRSGHPGRHRRFRR